jgi:hypothetical protein
MAKGCQIIDHHCDKHVNPVKSVTYGQSGADAESQPFRLKFEVYLIMLSLNSAIFSEIYEYIFTFSYEMGKRWNGSKKKSAGGTLTTMPEMPMKLTLVMNASGPRLKQIGLYSISIPSPVAMTL